MQSTIEPEEKRGKGRPNSLNPLEHKVETFLNAKQNDTLNKMRGTIPRSVFVRSILESAILAHKTVKRS